MTSARKSLFACPRLPAALAALLPLAAAFLLSVNASAGEEGPDAGFRFYFALPFIATGDPQPARLGLQLLSEFDNQTAFTPLESDKKLDTALDLGFTREGLAKFDIVGKDARESYEMFARAIGLTPDEVELCRVSDCLDWVKGGREAALSDLPPGQD